MGKQRGKSDFKGKSYSSLRDRGKKNNVDIKSEEEVIKFLTACLKGCINFPSYE